MSEGGAALPFEASWHDAPNTTESSGDNAPTLQMIDMIVDHAELIGAALARAAGRQETANCVIFKKSRSMEERLCPKEGLSMVLSLYLGSPLGIILFRSLDKFGGAFEEPFLRLEDRTRPMRR